MRLFERTARNVKEALFSKTINNCLILIDIALNINFATRLVIFWHVEGLNVNDSDKQ